MRKRIPKLLFYCRYQDVTFSYKYYRNVTRETMSKIGVAYIVYVAYTIRSEKSGIQTIKVKNVLYCYGKHIKRIK